MAKKTQLLGPIHPGELVVLVNPDLIDKMGAARLPSILSRPRVLCITRLPVGFIPKPCGSAD